RLQRRTCQRPRRGWRRFSCEGCAISDRRPSVGCVVRQSCICVSRRLLVVRGHGDGRRRILLLHLLLGQVLPLTAIITVERSPARILNAHASPAALHIAELLS